MEKQKMNFTEITTAEQLKNYLCSQVTKKSTGEKIFCHYTKMKWVIKIFKKQTLRFSKLSEMNDILETAWAGTTVPNEYYFCLAEGKENFGMWAMYGGLKNGSDEKYVKLEIKAKDLAKLLGDKTYNLTTRKIIYTDLLHNKNKDSFTPEKISISTDTKNENRIPVSRKDFAGFVKDDIWIYEKELRLCCIPPKKIDEPHFDISVDEGFLKSIKIVPSPKDNFDLCRIEFCNGLGNENYRDNFKKNDFRDYFQ